MMPNHIHGILIFINNPLDFVEMLHVTSLQNQPYESKQMSKISPKSNSISTIICSYKSAVTKHCNRLGFEFSWQSLFHDHIIRDEQSFENIQNYIANNPLNW